MINKNLILVDLELNSKEELIKTVVKKSHEEGLISDEQSFYDSIMERENIEPTNLGYSIAIPHGKSGSVKKPFVSFVRVQNPIKWNDSEVKLIFLMGLPVENSEKEHLRFLSSISRKLVKEEFREELNKLESQTEIYEMLSNIESKGV